MTAIVERKKATVPRTFNPLSRSAYRWAQRNGIFVQRLGKKQNRWIEALTSGEYKKAIGVLCAVSSSGQQYHCCLGVICELTPNIDFKYYEHGYSSVKQKVNGQNSAVIKESKLFNGVESVLPDDVEIEYAFRSDDGELDTTWVDEFMKNDSKGVFNECDSLKEVRKYASKFHRITNELGFRDLTELNDGKDVNSIKNKIIFTHKEIAKFVKAYPQAIFELVV